MSKSSELRACNLSTQINLKFHTFTLQRIRPVRPNEKRHDERRLFVERVNWLIRVQCYLATLDARVAIAVHASRGLIKSVRIHLVDLVQDSSRRGLLRRCYGDRERSVRNLRSSRLLRKSFFVSPAKDDDTELTRGKRGDARTFSTKTKVETRRYYGAAIS